MTSTEENVLLKVYDVSRGMASILSPQLLGYTLKGVWHTSLVVFNKEFFYGGGLQEQNPEEFERDNNIHAVTQMALGKTSKTYTEFATFLTSIAPQFTEATYDLIKWNCNHFTNTCLMFLLGKPLKKEYLHQHEPLMATPMGSLIINMLQGMNVQNPVNSNKHQFQPNASLPKNTEQSKSFQDALHEFHIAHEPSMKKPSLEFLHTLMDDIISHASQTNPLSSFTITSDNVQFQQHIHPVHPYGEQCLFALGFQKNSIPEYHEYFIQTVDADLKQKLHQYKQHIQILLQNDSIPQIEVNVNNSNGMKSKVPKYALQLEKLASMGFNDINLCLQALNNSNGNLNSALDYITSFMNP